MGKFVPTRDFECEQVSDGLLVCSLDGGEVRFAERDGKWHVDVSYETMPDYGTHIGLFSSVNEAGYRMTHGVIPMRLAALLMKNGILVKED